MAKAKKLPSGSWRVQVYAGKDSSGKKIMKSFTAETRKEAELMAAQFSAQHREPVSEMTVGKAIDKYIESKSNVLSPTTIRSYRTMRKNNLQGIMDIQLRNLTRQAIQNEINDMASKLSAKTVSNAYGLLSSSLAIYAPDLNVRVALPKRQKKIRTMPDPEEIIRIIQGTSIELPCMLAIWLGMRVSEIRGLKKSDVRNGQLIIHSSIVTVEGEQIVKEQTKTYESTRVSDIPPYIQKLIDEVETEYLTELTRDQIYTRFRTLQKANGIEPLISFHDLRHLNASVMVKLNVPDKYAMERGGWSTNSTLKNVYQHTFSDERAAVNTRINDYFEEILNKSSHENSHDNEPRT